MHSPVFRILGDEFVICLTGRDYDSRFELMQRLHEQSVEHIGTAKAVISGGMSEFLPGKDRDIHDVFNRAD